MQVPISVTCSICGTTYSIPGDRKYASNPCPSCKSVRTERNDARHIQSGNRVVVLGNSVVTAPYEIILLREATTFITQKQYSIAVIIAQTACEVKTERSLATLVRANADPELGEFVNSLNLTYSITSNQTTQKLYQIVTGDESMKKIKQQPFWEKLKEAVNLRNQIVHRGENCSEEQAKAAVEAAQAYLYFSFHNDE